MVNRVLYQRFWGKVLPCLIVAVGLTQVMQQGAFVTFGIHTKSIPTYFEGILNIFGARFPLERLMIIVVAVVLIAGLLILLRYNWRVATAFVSGWYLIFIIGSGWGIERFVNACRDPANLTMPAS